MRARTACSLSPPLSFILLQMQLRFLGAHNHAVDFAQGTSSNLLLFSVLKINSSTASHQHNTDSVL